MTFKYCQSSRTQNVFLTINCASNLFSGIIPKLVRFPSPLGTTGACCLKSESTNLTPGTTRQLAKPTSLEKTTREKRTSLGSTYSTKALTKSLRWQCLIIVLYLNLTKFIQKKYININIYIYIYSKKCVIGFNIECIFVIHLFRTLSVDVIFIVNLSWFGYDQI